MEKINQLKLAIKNLDLDNVCEDDLTKIICDLGLVYNKLDDYGEFDDFMVSKDGIFQTPKQLSMCLMDLLKYDEINSYLEIGIYQGGTYLLISELLKKKNPNCVCNALDITDVYLTQNMRNSIDGFILGDSSSIKGKEYDLVFIDGDHSFKGLIKDWENIGKYANMIMFHDINNRLCPDVMNFWTFMKVGNSCKEFLYQSESKQIHGIGLLLNYLKK